MPNETKHELEPWFAKIKQGYEIQFMTPSPTTYLMRRLILLGSAILRSSKSSNQFMNLARQLRLPLNLSLRPCQICLATLTDSTAPFRARSADLNWTNWRFVELVNAAIFSFFNVAILLPMGSVIQQNQHPETWAPQIYVAVSTKPQMKSSVFSLTQKGLLQVGKGLQFLHNDAKVVHSNLTPDAILVNAK
ncbi:hypothetical protein BC938DRAFT_477880, partial [Jimgerdemannia flammicorona]